MLNLGDVVIPMPQNFNITYLVGNEQIEKNMEDITALPVFSDEAISFLGLVSKCLLNDRESRLYPDVVTFGFWCRKASINAMRKPYEGLSNVLGRGVVFHIAPSNVAVNFAYSCVAALLAGNASIVRLPSKSFKQVDIICRAFKKAITELPNMRKYFLFVRYGHDKKINDIYSSICDTRVIWGGDETINELRKSPMKPRANEITFADRYSMVIIGAEGYLEADNKDQIAQNFYNDTYLTDQNACTSPRLVFWLGDKITEAREEFWDNLHNYVSNNYELQPIQAVDKLTNIYRLGAEFENIKLAQMQDNLITRVEVGVLSDKLMDCKMNSGFFIEYTAREIKEILPLCDSRCQTISYYGINPSAIREVIARFLPKGVDRIVPMGRTMDFSLIWDGYDLIRTMSRMITI